VRVSRSDLPHTQCTGRPLNVGGPNCRTGACFLSRSSSGIQVGFLPLTRTLRLCRLSFPREHADRDKAHVMEAPARSRCSKGFSPLSGSFPRRRAVTQPFDKKFDERSQRDEALAMLRKNGIQLQWGRCILIQH
jgi:hypothetical protein